MIDELFGKVGSVIQDHSSNPSHIRLSYNQNEHFFYRVERRTFAISDSDIFRFDSERFFRSVSKWASVSPSKYIGALSLIRVAYYILEHLGITDLVGRSS